MALLGIEATQAQLSLRQPGPGMPLEVLQSDWWLPGSTLRADAAKYQGKGQWKEILTCTPETCLLWATRVTQDHLMVGMCSQNTFQFTLRDASLPSIDMSLLPVPTSRLGFSWWTQDFARKVGKDGTTKSKDGMVVGLHI